VQDRKYEKKKVMAEKFIKKFGKIDRSVILVVPSAIRTATLKTPPTKMFAPTFWKAENYHRKYFAKCGFTSSPL